MKKENNISTGRHKGCPRDTIINQINGVKTNYGQDNMIQKQVDVRLVTSFEVGTFTLRELDSDTSITVRIEDVINAVSETLELAKQSTEMDTQ